jgi:hypothetical protein
LLPVSLALTASSKLLSLFLTTSRSLTVSVSHLLQNKQHIPKNVFQDV